MTLLKDSVSTVLGVFPGEQQTKCETLAVLARITDGTSGALLDPESIVSATINLYKVNGNERTSVIGHESAEVPISCFYSTLQKPKMWVRDDTGCNFVFIFNQRDHWACEVAGVYEADLLVTRAADANPIKITYRFVAFDTRYSREIGDLPSASETTFVWHTETPVTTWVIPHNLAGSYLDVRFYDDELNPVMAGWERVNGGTIKAEFSMARAGYCVVRS